MPLLVLGGTGQVGTEIRALAPAKNLEIVAPSRCELDLQDESAVAKMIAAEQWDAVVNAAAYTDVDRAETEQAAAFAINAEAAAQLAAETGRRGIPLIHISTDYVFDGRKGAPYVEQDKMAPLNAYGRTKLAGERSVHAANPRHVILRTSWVYSPYRKNFVRTILSLAAERDQLTIVADQRGCPTAATDIAGACLEIAMRCASEPERTPYGVYHFAGAGGATWFDFAKAIIEMTAGRLGKSPQILPIRTVDYPTPAVRAADTRLDSSSIVRAFGVKLRPWRQALEETINRLLTQRGIA
jgi:dTDP-4-dehydrorhamnose reductase